MCCITRCAKGLLARFGGYRRWERELVNHFPLPVGSATYGYDAPFHLFGKEKQEWDETGASGRLLVGHCRIGEAVESLPLCGISDITAQNICQSGGKALVIRRAAQCQISEGRAMIFSTHDQAVRSVINILHMD